MKYKSNQFSAQIAGAGRHVTDPSLLFSMSHWLQSFPSCRWHVLIVLNGFSLRSLWRVLQRSTNSNECQRMQTSANVADFSFFSQIGSAACSLLKICCIEPLCCPISAISLCFKFQAFGLSPRRVEPPSAFHRGALLHVLPVFRSSAFIDHGELKGTTNHSWQIILVVRGRHID